MTEERVVISSLLVDCLPEKREKVAERLAALDGVEVHGQEGGQVVITIERPSLDASHDLANSITQIEDVIGVNLIYVNFEDDETQQAAYEALHG